MRVRFTVRTSDRRSFPLFLLEPLGRQLGTRGFSLVTTEPAGRGTRTAVLETDLEDPDVIERELRRAVEATNTEVAEDPTIETDVTFEVVSVEIDEPEGPGMGGLILGLLGLAAVGGAAFVLSRRRQRAAATAGLGRDIDHLSPESQEKFELGCGRLDDPTSRWDSCFEAAENELALAGELAERRDCAGALEAFKLGMAEADEAVMASHCAKIAPFPLLPPSRPVDAEAFREKAEGVRHNALQRLAASCPDAAETAEDFGFSDEVSSLCPGG